MLLGIFPFVIADGEFFRRMQLFDAGIASE
jgi:hypothetical protein